MSITAQERREWVGKTLQQHKPLRICIGCGGNAKLNYKTGLFGTDILEQTAPASEVGAQCETFTFYCAHCSHLVGTFLDLQAAISMWHRCNKPRCADSLRLWNEAHQQQISSNKD